MRSNSTENLFIEMVTGKVPEFYIRDLHRYKYKFAERFWSLALLIFEQDEKIFQSRISVVLALHSELFFNALGYYCHCLEKLDQMDRDTINSHRDKNAIYKYVIETLKVINELEQTLNEIIESRVKKNSPFEYSLSLSGNPQPYLPTCEQVIKGICKLTDFKLTNDTIEWPYQQLSKMELKKLQKLAKKIFPYTILNEITTAVTIFDNSSKIKFSAFQVVSNEVDAVHDYLPQFSNFLQLNNEQIGFRITEKYRNQKGEQLNPATVNRNIQRYYEKVGT